eukprot:s1851_g3.t1
MSKDVKSFSVLRLKAELFLERLEGDWDRASAKKPWLYRDAWSVHAACGGFNAIIDQLKESVPQKDFKEALPGLCEQFRLGILDGDIVNFLETTVPPICLDQAQQTERELAEKVNQATVEHLKHNFAKDMAVLRGRVPDQTQIARDAALDKKYLADRQKSHGQIHALLA